MRITMLFITLFFFSLAASAQKQAWLIVPGKSIGQVAMEAPAASLDVLGKPDGGDAAMMKAWRFWYSRKKDDTIDSTHLLGVYTAMRTADTQYVKQIRVNSPKFRTAKGVGAGSTMAAIKKAYPALKRVKVYVSKDKQQRIEVYDDKRQGIAFETANPRSKQPVCSMVVVHDPGEELSIYMDYHTGFDNMLPADK